MRLDYRPELAIPLVTALIACRNGILWTGTEGLFMNHSGQAVSIGSAARAVVVFGLVLLPAGLRAADVADARAKLEANYADNLTELAAWCDQRQLKAEA